MKRNQLKFRTHLWGTLLLCLVAISSTRPLWALTISSPTQTLHITCPNGQDPGQTNPSASNLVRAIGDGNSWTFQVVGDNGATVNITSWTVTENGTTLTPDQSYPTWGLFHPQGNSLTWTGNNSGFSFSVHAKGKRGCGAGGGAGAGNADDDIDAEWDGTDAGVEICEGTGATLPANVTNLTVVGLNVVLGSKVTVPPGSSAGQYAWSIPDKKVKSYQLAVQDVLHPTLISAGDLQGTGVNFFWIDSGAKTVSLTVPIDNVNFSASVQYQVETPTINTITGTYTNWNPCINIGSNIFHTIPGGYECMYFGIANGTNGNDGITMKGSVSPAADFPTGQIGFVQLCNVNRTGSGVAQYPGQPVFACNMTRVSGAYVLDDGGGTPYAGGCDISQVNTIFDSPFQPDQLPAVDPMPAWGLTFITCGDNFKTYLMFQSGAGPSIWVTLGELNWSWGGSSTFNTNTNLWNAITGRTPATPGGQTTGSTTTELPEWDNVYSNTPTVITKQ